MASAPQGARRGEPVEAARAPVELCRDNLSVVRRVWQDPPGRFVGCRELLPAVDPRSPLGALLSREARALARLDHPGLARLLDVAPTRLVFEDPGATLAAWIAAARAAPPGEELAGRAPEAAILGVGLQLARALAHAASAGVLHAHLRPACVGLRPGGRVVLFDFSRALVEGEPPPPAHELVAAPEPTAPEAQRDAVGPATDVFGVGAVLLALATRAPPDRRAAAVEALPPSLRGSALESVLRRALARDPAARFPDPAALAEHLARLVGGDDEARAAARALLEGEAERAPEPRPSRLPARGPAASLVGLSAVLLAGLAAIDLLWRAPAPAGDAGPPLGSVRVLARPWAELHVDGRRVDTTPIGQPLVLPAGRHDLLFTHPAAPDERRTIELRAGETQTVRVEMAVQRPAAPRPAASAEEQP